jgi:adenine-specific DNA-methyltransferase
MGTRTKPRVNGSAIRESPEREYVGVESLLTAVDAIRSEAMRQLDARRRVLMGQFLTPASVARFMAEMVEGRKPILRILDPGAGVGSLSAALVAVLCRRSWRPDAITLTAYEIDPVLIGYLRSTLELCRMASEAAGIRFEARLLDENFLESGLRNLNDDLFTPATHERFDCAILNPPYRKIRTDSRERKLLRAMGVETSNLYTGFLAVTASLLAEGGEMIAITPRSFCNGPYFEPFRRFFLRDMRFRQVHLFDARDRAFADDEVLQENVVFQAERTSRPGSEVMVSSSREVTDSIRRSRAIKYEDFVRPGDPHLFIHIVPDGAGDSVSQRMRALDRSLTDLGLSVSTGRVVDFRAKKFLRDQPGRNTVPLIYPCHFHQGFIDWPKNQVRKPNALALEPQTNHLVVSAGNYVLVKRFSAKEEPRRIVAAVYDPTRVPADQVAFENHLNYYHRRGAGLPLTVAKGLAAFLNSTVVDSYFRQFSGHTQVNAADLRSLRYPTWEKLGALGQYINGTFPPQADLDRLVEEISFNG